MSLYDPHSNSTPSQRLAWAAHNARKTKIALKAKNIPVPISKAVEPEIVEPQSSSFSLWVARQERFNPLPKKQWFSVECDVSPEPVKPTIEKIQRVICDHFNVSRTDLLSARRTAKIVLPRQIGYYLAKTLTAKSLPEIGSRFGGRDHTTAMSGIRKIEKLRGNDPILDAQIVQIIERLECA